MRVRILDLDGSITEQRELMETCAPEVVPARDWGPRVRICCSFPAYERFERECVPRLGDAAGEPAITFCGSGDFHHVTVALLRRLKEPFNLLVLDKHPDWVGGAPLMHCGTWVNHAIRIPNLLRMFQLGTDHDLDNTFRFFAPWKALRDGKIKPFPAVKRLTRGNWRSVPTEPMLTDSNQPMSMERLETLCSAFRDELALYPLYISIDKDLLRTSDCITNWDSGRLELAEVQTVLTWFVAAARGRLSGMDVIGDWARPDFQGVLRTVLNKTEHPPLRVDPAEAAVVNGRTNRVLVETVTSAISGAASRRC